MNAYFIFYDDQLLLDIQGDQFELPTVLGDGIEKNEIYDIGEYYGHRCYAVDAVSIVESDQCQLMSLKSALSQIDVRWFSAATRAYQIIRWDANHSFCGKCGETVYQVDQRFEKHCDRCQLSYYPKLSPAIIVRIQKGDQILLARQTHYPDGVYGLIAGFVEVGETLEEALRREVYEEVGITVKNIQYFGSQPWPFPDSLMIAFTADYESGEIQLRDGELEMADWFSADSIPGFPSSLNSIAQHLLDNFLNCSDLC